MKHEWPIEAEAAIGSRQWIFDRVVEHHRKQRARCPEHGQCWYRFGDRRCFVGALLGDEHYDPTMEGMPARNLHEIFRLPPWFTANIVMIERLQGLHDAESNWPAERMDGVLAGFALDNGLRMPA